MSQPIENYGFIGNMVSGALVGLDGSIDWLCLPRFDSDACFAALLGTPEHLALLGRHQDALRPFARLLSIRSDIGLLADGSTCVRGGCSATSPRPSPTSA